MSCRCRRGRSACKMEEIVSDIYAQADAADLAEAVRRQLRELERTHGPGASIGECRPPIDVYETGENIEVTPDLPAFGPDEVPVVVRENAVPVVGEKAAARGAPMKARFTLA